MLAGHDVTNPANLGPPNSSSDYQVGINVGRGLLALRIDQLASEAAAGGEDTGARRAAIELEKIADEIRAEAADPANTWQMGETYRAGRIYHQLRDRAALLRAAGSSSRPGAQPGEAQA